MVTVERPMSRAISFMRTGTPARNFGWPFLPAHDLATGFEPGFLRSDTIPPCTLHQQNTTIGSP
jgi:hypothetical protein